MARTNKYTSINFNDIFEKKSKNTTNSKPSSSSTSTPSSSSSSAFQTRNHGGMLVLTRPTPKPLPQIAKPQLAQTPKPSSQDPDHHHHHPQPRSEPDSIPTISLRPLGQTGSSSISPASPSLPSPSPPSSQERESLVSLKPEPFVPPHLRPGFVGKKEKFGQVRSREIGNNGLVQYGSPNGYNDGNGRPKSGGGYERMRRESDLGILNRPSSSGNRPNSSDFNRPSSSGNRPNSSDFNRPSSSGNRPSSSGGGGWYGSSYRSPTHF